MHCAPEKRRSMWGYMLAGKNKKNEKKKNYKCRYNGMLDTDLAEVESGDSQGYSLISLGVAFGFGAGIGALAVIFVQKKDQYAKLQERYLVEVN